MKALLIVILSLCLSGPAQAEGQRIDGPGRQCSTGQFGHIGCIRSVHFVHDTCTMLQDAARRHYIDPHFFARLIWQESRFEPSAVSPADARGIAQFTDDVADARGLDDRLNPAESIERSAQYLSYLRQENGNLGLAAMAYRAGAARAFGFMAGNVALPEQLRDYVWVITGLTAEQWRNDPPHAHDFRLSKDVSFLEGCYALLSDRHRVRITPPGIAFAPWGAELGFGRTEKSARTNAKRATQACQRVVDAHDMQVLPMRNRVAGRKGVWVVRLAADTHAEAGQICTELRTGGCACRVTPTR